MDWLRAQWAAFRNSAQANIYNYIWWAILELPMTLLGWFWNHVPWSSAIFVVSPLWRDRFFTAFITLLCITILGMGPSLLHGMAEKARMQAQSDLVEIAIPIRMKVPRDMIVSRVRWKNVALWTVVFTTMGWLAERASVPLLGAIFITFTVLVLLGSWSTFRKQRRAERKLSGSAGVIHQ